MDFQSFKKIPRLSRECVLTEKIDGTNGIIAIGENGEFQIGSRNQWLTDANGNIFRDNAGFAKWAVENRDELVAVLGVGYHYGEWWGKGIQRGYGLNEKRFSLFNTSRWSVDNCPSCCSVVPVLYSGIFTTDVVDTALDILKNYGSMAVPGFMKPEGVVIYHIAAKQYFKKTIENDAFHKGEI